VPVFPVVFEPPALTGRYQHMARRDAELWERYLEKFAHLWQGFAYDVALGGLVVEDAASTPEQLKGWQYSTAEKIDVVANRGDEQWIIEVRPNARCDTIGSVLGYLLLAQREPWTTLPLVPCILTENMSPDARWVAEQLNVEVIILPAEPLRPLA
jgi:hypothetical protein